MLKFCIDKHSTEVHDGNMFRDISGQFTGYSGEGAKLFKFRKRQFEARVINKFQQDKNTAIIIITLYFFYNECYNHTIVSWRQRLLKKKLIPLSVVTTRFKIKSQIRIWILFWETHVNTWDLFHSPLSWGVVQIPTLLQQPQEGMRNMCGIFSGCTWLQKVIVICHY